MIIQSIFPACLLELVEYLRNRPSVLSDSASISDPRLSSSLGVREISNAVKEASQWDVEQLGEGHRHNRQWVDLRVEGHLIDIKISTLKNKDNTNASSHIAYLLTGMENVSSSKLFKIMKGNESPDETRDLYYLIINKNNPQDVFPVSLRNIRKVHPNPSNLPFQAQWDECREPLIRTWDQAKQFLLEKWAESIDKRIRSLIDGMPTYYRDFFPRSNYYNYLPDTNE